MIFLLDDDQRESHEALTHAPAVSHAPAGTFSALKPAVIGGAQLLVNVVTRSKQTTATRSKRYFFGTFCGALQPTTGPGTRRA